MLREWTQGVPVRTFTYDSAGRMTQATVFTLTTRFTYNGDGARRVVEVVGHGTTLRQAQGRLYTVDYAAGNRILAETMPTSTVTYLYGHDCLGEFRDGEWLYYLNDATGYVRQGADEQGQVTSAWLFDPDGALLEGPQGPVSHLICGGVYDWSTGLIFKGGRYFDPSLGIWLALTPLVVLQSWRGRKRKRRGVPWFVVLLLVMGVGGMLTGCGEVTPPPGGDTPAPEEVCTNTPMPETPQPTPETPQPTPETPTPIPTPMPDPDLYRITNEEVNTAGGMLNYLLGESEALLLARVGMGEGAQQSPDDREYVMWTVKVRATVGLSNNLISPTSIKQEILAAKADGSYDYLAIGVLIAFGYPENITDCGSNIKRMGYPCDQDLEAFRDTYNEAQTIVASDIRTMPESLQGFDSFVGRQAGGPKQYCTWGQFAEGYNRPSEDLAGGNIFFDCVLEDNLYLGLIEEIPG